MPIPLRVAQLNHRVTHPLPGMLSDQVWPTATLHHVGRAAAVAGTAPRSSRPARRAGSSRTSGTQVPWLGDRPSP